MNKINIVIILIVGFLVVFALGAGLGIFYQYQKDDAKIKQADKISSEIDTLSSDVVTAVAVFGKVVAINGRNVTLSYNGKSLTVNIGDNVAINSYASLTAKTGGNVQFSEIKLGDNLSVALKIGKDGELIAQNVLILSSGANNSPAQ